MPKSKPATSQPKKATKVPVKRPAARPTRSRTTRTPRPAAPPVIPGTSGPIERPERNTGDGEPGTDGVPE